MKKKPWEITLVAAAIIIVPLFIGWLGSDAGKQTLAREIADQIALAVCLMNSGLQIVIARSAFRDEQPRNRLAALFRAACGIVGVAGAIAVFCIVPSPRSFDIYVALFASSWMADMFPENAPHSRKEWLFCVSAVASAAFFAYVTWHMVLRPTDAALR